MKETMVKKIGDYEYQFFMLPAMDSVKLFLRIIKIVGPALMAVEGKEEKEESILDRKIDIKQLVEALQNSLHETEVEGIINILLSQTLCEGVGQLSSKAVVNEHFKGNIKHLFMVIWGALEAQYSDFLAGKPELENLVTGKKIAKKVG